MTFPVTLEGEPIANATLVTLCGGVPGPVTTLLRGAPVLTGHTQQA